MIMKTSNTHALVISIFSHLYNLYIPAVGKNGHLSRRGNAKMYARPIFSVLIIKLSNSHLVTSSLTSNVTVVA